MKKAKTISRKKILQALRNEPLSSGQWVSYDGEGRVENDPNCEVCAVGAVLRNAGYSNRQIDVFGEFLCGIGPVSQWHDEININENGADGVIENLLEEKKYLNALSLKFEDQAQRTGTGKRTRKVLARFVKEHFPKRVRLQSKEME